MVKQNLPRHRIEKGEPPAGSQFGCTTLPASQVSEVSSDFITRYLVNKLQNKVNYILVPFTHFNEHISREKSIHMWPVMYANYKYLHFGVIFNQHISTFTSFDAEIHNISEYQIIVKTSKYPIYFAIFCSYTLLQTPTHEM